jgi:hypothetical protein
MNSGEMGFDNRWLAGTGLIWLVALVPQEARAERLTVNTRGPVQCASQSQKPRALGEHVATGGPPQGELELSVPRPGALHMRLQHPSAPLLGRDCELRSRDCNAIAQTLAVIAESSLRPLSPVATDDCEIIETKPAPPNTPPPAASLAVEVAPNVVPSVGVARALTARGESFVHLALRRLAVGDLLFGSSYGFDSIGKLSAEVAIGKHWSIGASKSEFNYETRLQQHTSITVFGRPALHARKSGLSLAAGFLLDIITADLKALEGAGHISFYQLGATASLQWEYPFARRFSAFVDVGLLTFFANSQMTHSRYLRLPNARVDTTTGLACRFF